jgi:putative transposase
MPSRYLQRNFKPKHYYHIFNRGGFKQKIFLNKKDYTTFIDILRYYLRYPQLKPLSRLTQKKLEKAKIKSHHQPFSLLAYCLMPNHFHLLLRQNLTQPTLTDLLRKVSTTYAMYFQYRYRHSGSLFQGRFRCVNIFDDEQLLYLTKYIHLNPQKSAGTVPTDFIYSSLRDYLHLNQGYKNWLDSHTIYEKFFNQSKNAPADYLKFLSSLEDEKKIIKLLKQKLLE